MVPVMESCPEARDLGGFNLLADKAALGGEEASLAARRSRFSIELLLLLSLSTKKNFVLVTGCTITSPTWRRATPPRESTSCASVPQVGVGDDDDDDDGSPR